MASGIPTNIFIPLMESPEGYYEPFDVVNDGLAAGGFFPQDSHTTDDTVGIYRIGNDLYFEDPNAGTVTLTQLLEGATGFDPNRMILDTDGSLTYIDDGDILLRQSA
jgi:hypothetical protein